MTDQFFGATDTGKVRQNNEDAFIAQLSADKRFIIASVIDGVGGYAGGEVAAELCRIAIIETLALSKSDPLEAVFACFKNANQNILGEKQQTKGYEQMGCVASLALADVENNQFYYAHVGDTRLYLFRDHSLVKISHDQSFVGFLEDSGRLTEEEAMNHPKRNEINKAIGFDRSISTEPDYIETGQSPFLPGDVLLLCSDGLTDMVNSAEITGILNSDTTLKDKCNLLIEAANTRGGRDNVTAVLVQNSKSQVKREPVKVIETKKSMPETGFVSPTETKSHPETVPLKKNNLPVIILSILLLLSIAISAYLYSQNKAAPTVTETTAIPVVKSPSFNAQEIKLQQAMQNLKGNVLILADSAYKTPLVISKAIQIDKDSLIIKLKGKIIIQSDSAYKGPAFVLTGKCKSLKLDSLSFQNFETCILQVNNAIELKNVRFINCRVSVNNNIGFAEKKYISGKILPIKLKSDSIPVIVK